MKRVVLIVLGLSIVAAGIAVLVEWRGGGWGTGSSGHATADANVTIEGAWSEVHAHPKSSVAWMRLAEAQARADQVVDAEHAYRTALRLGDDSGLAYARLGFLVYGQGRDDEARVLLMEARRRGAEVPMLEFTLRQLASAEAPEDPVAGTEPSGRATEIPTPSDVARSGLDAGFAGLDASWVPPPALALLFPVATAPPPAPASRPAPAELTPTVDGPCELALTRHGRVLLVDLWVEGVEATLLVDTGASMTVLTEAFAARAGIRADPRRVVNAITANGRVQMGTAIVGVEVGPYAKERTRVALCTDCVEDLADGLFGLDLQAALHVELDLSQARMRFGRCP